MKLLFSLLLLAASLPQTGYAGHKHRVAASPKEHTLTLYYFPTCPYCQKVLRYLDSIHKTVPMKDVRQDGAAKKELIQIGGRGTVPCLVVDGKAIYESDVIIDWLSKHQNWLNPA